MSLRNRVAAATAAVVLAALALASLVVYPEVRNGLSRERDNTLADAASNSPSLVRSFDGKSKTADGTSGPTTAGRRSAAGVKVGSGEAASKSPAAEPTSSSGSKGASGKSSSSTSISGDGGESAGEVAIPKSRVPDKPFTVGQVTVQFIPDPEAAASDRWLGPVTKADLALASGRGKPYFSTTVLKGVEYRVYTDQLIGVDGSLVRTAVRTSADSPALRRLALLLGGLTLAGCLLAAGAARLLAGRVLNPVRRLTATVERVAATGDLSLPVQAGGRDEIGRLAHSFGAVMAALDISVRARRSLVADASHELRTPLTSLTTNLELLDEGPGTADPQAPALARAAREQAGELTALVNDLIELARYGDSERAADHREDVRLDLLAERAAERAERDAPHVRILRDLDPSLVSADPDALERVVGNLLGNAVKFSPQGGRVLLRLAEAGGHAELTVDDEGPGISGADLPHVFDRFYRSPSARAKPGSGLGLAIVREIVQAHGGSVEAQPRTPGVRLAVRLPALR